MLKIEKLHAFYGKSHVLHGVAFNVHSGEIVALLGRNGSGRSTTAKAIMGGLRQAVAEGGLRAKIGALLLKKDFRRIGATLDPEEYGGTYLLGMNYPVIIAHGNARARGIGNAVLVAARGVTSGLLPTIAARLGAGAPGSGEAGSTASQSEADAEV